jgi:hypothetical protein
MKTPITLCLICLYLYSCSPTNLMSLNVMKPSPVSIPAGIRSVGLIDRTAASKEARTINTIHQVLSLESSELPKEGARASVQGLSDELSKNSRFSKVVSLTNLDLYSVGAGIFPASLPWDTVEKICLESHSDALFSLELFDASSKVGFGANAVSVTNGFGLIPGLLERANLTTEVKTGWRIYDPSTRTILDEYILTHDLNFSVNGINPLKAVTIPTEQKEAVKQAGTQAGQAYATRILPYWIRVSREYFVGGDDQFTIAKRKAQAGDWDGAAVIWQKETTSASGKLAGRGCYNMAIISEINGDLDGAISWAQKAYENYGIRLALSYLNILRYRKGQNEVLKSQNAVSSIQPQ